LRGRAQELRAGLIAGQLRSTDVLPEAFAIIRESMDRHIGIREVFNPEQNFDPDKFSDADLEAYDSVQRHMIATGQPWQQVEIPVQVYEGVRKLYPESRLPFRARCFDVQLIGGLVLYEGKIAEMATGEGKTFVAPLACFMRVLGGSHAHVVTVNDYLVRRDASWIRPAFVNLGFDVGFIQQDMEPGGPTRRAMYEKDVTYGTNSEFGFDYLRDNMKERADLQVQGPLDYAIVDEVDSILIDEARTPLIISGAAHDDAPKYKAADAVARKILEMNAAWDRVQDEVDRAKRAIKAAEGDADKAKSKEDKIAAQKRGEEAQQQLEAAEAKKDGLTQYYEVELDRKTVHLTHDGIAAAQQIAGVGSFYVGNNMEWPHLMEQALRAHVVYERDKDYVVERGQRGEMEVVIVDEYTGRKMVGRQWSDGLHQAIEAKERVQIKQETQTLATITLQNFFKLYKSLSGMTGTAQTEAEEFQKIYKLEVVTIPTNRPRIREDSEDRVYRSEREKWDALIEEIKEASDKGRPVLVGTTSVEKSEMLSAMLRKKYGVEHNVLNAKYHEREAQIVAEAGQQVVNPHGEKVGRVTIATNMAGRGTDIKLTPEAHAAGGLHVIGTERHTARRIDNQLRGRSGRQGDPGSSRFYVSLQDDLMKMFAGEWTIKMLGWVGMEEGMAIEHKSITKGIVRAQKKVEERNYLARKNLLEYDEVMDKQRTSFYGMRQRVLEGRDVPGVIWDMIGQSIRDAVDKFVTQDFVAATVAEWVRVNFETNVDAEDLKGMRHFEELEHFIKDKARAEAGINISATLGEFLGEGAGEDGEGGASAWNAKELQSWAMSRFQVNLPQSQIRRMSERELEDRLRDAAVEQIDKRDCAGLLKYLEPLYAQRELAAWAKEKFNVDVAAEEMVTDARSNASRDAEEIVALIDRRAREAYARREVEYPVDHVLAMVTGGGTAAEAGAIENAYAADYVRGWARAKFGVEMPIEHVQSTPIRKLRDELIGYQEKALADGGADREVDAIVAKAAGGNAEQLVQLFNERFGIGLTAKDLDPKQAASTRKGHRGDVPQDADGDGQLSPAEILKTRAREWLRKELTDLEQFVLIQIFDQSWKDHLYAMDALKSGIGLHAFAERDPRILYKKEGFRYFEQMMEGVRDKVTDLIFKARIGTREPEPRSRYNEQEAVHAAAGGYGVGENVQATAEIAGVSPEQHAAAQGSAGEGEQATGVAVIKPIVRDVPKVGRNDPCPCGSGKKYKKCCGQDEA
ncbi:MAG TPA: SEC-C metal-binding domain-containing protein, partial [Tepidisphaeraceae bacterium]|nr:SEC-C metal-binding domain-containing protein [Tepidisphaeraceae bacterium]